VIIRHENVPGHGAIGERNRQKQNYKAEF